MNCPNSMLGRSFRGWKISEEISCNVTGLRYSEDMKTNWLTVIDGEIEHEHKTKADAVFWAQCTHCTEERPRRAGYAYELRRTTIVKREVWERWARENAV